MSRNVIPDDILKELKDNNYERHAATTEGYIYKHKGTGALRFVSYELCKKKITFEEFAKWVADQIFDKNVDDDVFCELACRKLLELGLVEKTDTDWIFTSTDKEKEK